MALYKGLAETFDRHDGALEGYLDNTLGVLTPTRHYDIRSYHNYTLTVPWTMLDMWFWNVDHFSTLTMDTMDSWRGTTADTMNELEDTPGGSLAAGGQEGWPVEAGVTFGPDSTLR